MRPNRADTDADGLNDSEEMSLGSGGFATDPWRTDTDGDGWSDGYETLTKGTNPLAWDTDGDGARDSTDLDPLRNLLVAVQVKQVHHGASPWCTPELVGIIRINDDYTWVSQHVVSTLDSFTSWACPPPIPTTQYSTSSFYMTYYADVPDDVSSVSLRATAWAINPGRGDDILVDQFVSYTLNSGTDSWTLWNGNSWYTFEVWTVGLAKAKTFFVTDGNATVTLANGQSRLVGQDRYYVLAFDVTSVYGPFVVGVNTIVVPRSIFLDSKLRADFDGGTFAPLTDATLYGEDLGQSKVSESVAGTIAKSLSGVDANDVLNRLLRNWAIKGVDAMVGFTHEDMGQIAARLERWTGSADDLEVYLRTYANARQSNNFTSYDLLQKPSTGSQLARDDVILTGRTWYVRAYDATVNKNGQIEYLQLQVTVHTFPNRADTDIDGLNDSEELNLGFDGFATDP